MKTINQYYTIHAPIEKVWQALVDPIVIDEWGGGPVTMDDKEGTEFSLWGGEIYGTNIKVIPNEMLEQEWFIGKWDKPSILTFTLSKKDNNITEVALLHKNVPDMEAKDIEQG